MSVNLPYDVLEHIISQILHSHDLATIARTSSVMQHLAEQQLYAKVSFPGHGTLRAFRSILRRDHRATYVKSITIRVPHNSLDSHRFPSALQRLFQQVIRRSRNLIHLSFFSKHTWGSSVVEACTAHLHTLRISEITFYGLSPEWLLSQPKIRLIESRYLNSKSPTPSMPTPWMMPLLEDIHGGQDTIARWVPGRPVTKVTMYVHQYPRNLNIFPSGLPLTALGQSTGPVVTVELIAQCGFSWVPMFTCRPDVQLSTVHTLRYNDPYWEFEKPESLSSTWSLLECFPALTEVILDVTIQKVWDRTKSSFPVAQSIACWLFAQTTSTSSKVVINDIPMDHAEEEDVYVFRRKGEGVERTRTGS